jgi:uncharacterized membrane protein HdeD (DUF308 family)
MTRDPELPDSSLTRALRTFRRPWPLLLAGLICMVFAAILSYFDFPSIPPRVLLMGLGVLLAGIAVSRRLQTASWKFEDRAESAGLLAVAAVVALLGLLAVYKEKKWDSAHLFFVVLLGLALGGAALVLLPRVWRRVVVLLLMLFHFGGIITAVTAVAPRNEPAPWISMMLWTHVYRHYLTFIYFTNAYHFYSPDPGPPTLLWFHVEYADGKSRWIKIPNKAESPTILYHQRMLAAAENAFNPITGFPPMTEEDVKAAEKKFKHKYELLPGIPHAIGPVIMKRREEGANIPFVDPQDGRSAPLKLIGDEAPPLLQQYSEPQEIARRLLASYARHVAHTSPDPTDAKNPVQAVRIYRVIHTIISPRELHEGKDPTDSTTFVPFYMGKYDPDGRLLDPEDPFLFWHVPIIRVPKHYPDGEMFLFSHWASKDEPSKVIDFVEIHATQSDRFLKSPQDK